jgi:hypothetical protein
MEHTQTRTLNHNRNNNHRTYPELVVTHSVSEQEATYNAALKLVARIDEDLTKGTRHYRNKAGVLLTTLDEVVHAILNDDLLLPEEREKPGVVWMAPQELAA